MFPPQQQYIYSASLTQKKSTYPQPFLFVRQAPFFVFDYQLLYDWLDKMRVLLSSSKKEPALNISNQWKKFLLYVYKNALHVAVIGHPSQYVWLMGLPEQYMSSFCVHNKWVTQSIHMKHTSRSV